MAQRKGIVSNSASARLAIAIAKLAVTTLSQSRAHKIENFVGRRPLHFAKINPLRRERAHEAMKVRIERHTGKAQCIGLSIILCGEAL
jgi:hypothetical protein